jgi:hypothetical protein
VLNTNQQSSSQDESAQADRKPLASADLIILQWAESIFGAKQVQENIP